MDSRDNIDAGSSENDQGDIEITTEGAKRIEEKIKASSSSEENKWSQAVENSKKFLSECDSSWVRTCRTSMLNHLATWEYAGEKLLAFVRFYANINGPIHPHLYALARDSLKNKVEFAIYGEKDPSFMTIFIDSDIGKIMLVVEPKDGENALKFKGTVGSLKRELSMKLLEIGGFAKRIEWL